MRAVGCWENRTRVWKLHGWSLSLFSSLMLQKDQRLFSADHSTLLSRSGQVPALAKVTWGETPQLSWKSLRQSGTVDSCCHPPVYSCYGAPSGPGSRSWRVAPLFASVRVGFESHISLLFPWSCLETLKTEVEKWDHRLIQLLWKSHNMAQECARPPWVYVPAPTASGLGAGNSISVFIIQDTLQPHEARHQNGPVAASGEKVEVCVVLQDTPSQTTGGPQSNIFIVSKDCDIISWIHSITVLACLCLALITLKESI